MTFAPLRILLVGDYANDPRPDRPRSRTSSARSSAPPATSVTRLFAEDLGHPARRAAGPAARLPVLGHSAISRAIAQRPYDVVDAASAEGLWFGAGKRLGRRRSTVFICRSNGLEHRNYNSMLDDSRAGSDAQAMDPPHLVLASRLSQVAAAARIADRLLVLTEGDRQFALDRGWQSNDRIDVVAHGVSGPLSGAQPPGRARGPARSSAAPGT